MKHVKAYFADHPKQYYLANGEPFAGMEIGIEDAETGEQMKFIFCLSSFSFIDAVAVCGGRGLIENHSTVYSPQEP
jgi:hypothetical protein